MATILIVDDQPDNLYVLERLLKRQGYEVVQADSGEQALEQVRQNRPDLVLLDVMMPGMDGFEVVRLLREDATTRALPVVLLTANAPDQRLKIQGLNLGADEYLTQPINNSELLARVRALLRSKQAQDELRAVNTRLQTLLDVVQASNSTLDLDEVGERVVRGVLEAAEVDAGGIWLVQDQVFSVLWQQGFSPEFVAAHDRLNSPMCHLLWEVVRTRKPVHGLAAAVYGSTDVVTQALQTVLLLPLHLRDEGFGVLQLGTHKARTFDQDDLQFLQAIVNAGATAIQNARLYAATVQTQQELETANLEKDEFISIISHELKNPLASIKGYASLIQRRAKKDAGLDGAVKGLRVIEQQVGRMTLLLDHLRDVSHIGINRFGMEPLVMDLAELVERVAIDLQAATTDHELLITIKDAPLFANLDDFRISQVFNNLLSNAIKYSPEGSPIDITVSRTTADAVPMPLGPGEWSCVSVTDQGIGIAPEEQEHLFERFFRASNAKGKASGMGLGLFIAREIVVRHGGYMWVQSAIGKGSTFNVALPLVDQETARAAQAATLPATSVDGASADGASVDGTSVDGVTRNE